MIDFIQRITDWWRGNLLGGIQRSSQWDAVRRAFLKEHPTCAACGTKGSFLKPNEVHHQIPFSIDKSLELQSSNLIVLCRVHHQWLGHLGSFRSFNKDVQKDCEIFLEKVKNRP